jgi:hypothetical protein
MLPESRSSFRLFLYGDIPLYGEFDVKDKNVASYPAFCVTSFAAHDFLTVGGTSA